MNLLIITLNYPKISEQFINEEIRRLAEHYNEIHVANCLGQPSIDQNVSIEIPDNVKILDVKMTAHRLIPLVLILPKILYVLWKNHDLLLSGKFEYTWNAVICFLKIVSKYYMREYDCVYAHYISSPSIVANLLLNYSKQCFFISAHAADIYKSSPKYLSLVSQQASGVTTCTRFNQNYLQLCGVVNPDLIYHGFTPIAIKSKMSKVIPIRSGDIQFVTIARLVPKKGHSALLTLAHELKNRGLSFTWHFVGGGSLYKTLYVKTKELGLDDFVVWHGFVPQETCYKFISECDLFIYYSAETSDGDRDGIPNVLVESLALQTPIIVNDFAGSQEIERITGIQSSLNILAFDVIEWANQIMDASRTGFPVVEDETSVAIQETFSWEVSTKKLIEFLYLSGS